MIELTTEQAATVTETGSARYTREQWTTYLQAVAEKGKDVGKCEDDFPGVKPAHVRHMFRLILKSDEKLSKKLTVAKSADFGIVLKVR